MLELLKQYSIQEIVIFIILLALAFKGTASFWDWFRDWLKQKFDKNYDKDQKEKEINNSLSALTAITQDQQTQINQLMKSVNILVNSDKDSIKSWIVEKHHHFCYEVKAIDYYSLESIERRYEHYKQEEGNSYVATLMEELKALPKIESELIKNTMMKEEKYHQVK